MAKAAKKARKNGTSLEDDFAAALVFLGWLVVPHEQRESLACRSDLAKVVIREFVPRAPDPLTTKPRQYRLDFAHPASKLYVEIDGYGRYGGGRGGHATWAGFHRDREKDRCMVWNGWTPIRFGTADLADEGYKECARFFDAMIRKRLVGL